MNDYLWWLAPVEICEVQLELIDFKPLGVVCVIFIENFFDFGPVIDV